MTSTTTPFTFDQLEDALYEVEVEDATITTDYSGRFMFGETCFGVTVDDGGIAIGVALTLACRADSDDIQDAAQKAARIARTARTDSMGRSTIIYFPGWTLAEDDQ